jgi:hypothetical protein
MLYPEQPPLAIIAAVLVLVPLPRQLRAGNIACIALIFWFFQHCVVAAVNTIVWAGNVKDTAPIWCDISEFFPPHSYICHELKGHQLTDLRTLRLWDSRQRHFVYASIWSTFPPNDLLFSINAKFVEKYLK